MVEKYFQLNISSVVFHSPKYIFKRLVTVKRKPYICDQNLNAVKMGVEARKKTLHAIKVTSILKYA